MKIAMVEWFPRLCGVTDWIRHIAAGSSKKIETHLLTFSKSGNRLAAWEAGDAFDVHRTRDAVDVLNGYDLVITSDLACFAPALVKDPWYLEVLGNITTPWTSMYHGGPYPKKHDPVIGYALGSDAFAGVLLTTRPDEAKPRLAGFDWSKKFHVDPYLPYHSDWKTFGVKPGKKRRRAVMMTSRLAPNKGQELLVRYLDRFVGDVELWGYSMFGLPSIGWQMSELAVALKYREIVAPQLRRDKADLTDPEAKKFYSGRWEYETGKRRVRYHDAYFTLAEVDWSPRVHLTLSNVAFRGTPEYVALDAIACDVVAIVPEHALSMVRSRAYRAAWPTVPFTSGTANVHPKTGEIRARVDGDLEAIVATTNTLMRGGDDWEKYRTAQSRALVRNHAPARVLRGFVAAIDAAGGLKRRSGRRRAKSPPEAPPAAPRPSRAASRTPATRGSGAYVVERLTADGYGPARRPSNEYADRLAEEVRERFSTPDRPRTTRRSDVLYNWRRMGGTDGETEDVRRVRSAVPETAAAATGEVSRNGTVARRRRGVQRYASGDDSETTSRGTNDRRRNLGGGEETVRAPRRKKGVRQLATSLPDDEKGTRRSSKTKARSAPPPLIRGRKKPIAVAGDVFAGLQTVGVKAAGFDVVAQLEHSNYAVETTRRNHPKIDVRVEHCHWCAKDLASRNVGLMYTNPPCAPWSRLSPRFGGWQTDERIHWVPELATAAREMNAATFVWESVTGAWTQGRSFTIGVARDFAKAGYAVTILLQNNKYLGAPQNRVRMLFVAHRYPLVWPDLTEPTTVRDVLKGVRSPRAELKEAAISDLEREVWELAGPGGSLREAQIRMPEKKKRGGRFSFMCVRVAMDRPAPVLTCHRYHDVKPRKFTRTELLALHGLPLDYRTDHVERWHEAMAELQRSVLPSVGRWLATAIRDGLRRPGIAEPTCQVVDLKSGRYDAAHDRVTGGVRVTPGYGVLFDPFVEEAFYPGDETRPATVVHGKPERPKRAKPAPELSPNRKKRPRKPPSVTKHGGEFRTSKAMIRARLERDGFGPTRRPDREWADRVADEVRVAVAGRTTRASDVYFVYRHWLTELEGGTDVRKRSAKF